MWQHFFLLRPSWRFVSPMNRTSTCGTYCSGQTQNSIKMNDPIIHNLSAAVKQCPTCAESQLLLWYNLQWTGMTRSNLMDWSCLRLTCLTSSSKGSSAQHTGLHPPLVCCHLSECLARNISCFVRDPLGYIPATTVAFPHLAYEWKWLILS